MKVGVWRRTSFKLAAGGGVSMPTFCGACLRSTIAPSRGPKIFGFEFERDKENEKVDVAEAMYMLSVGK